MISRPPSTGIPSVDLWLQQVADFINTRPTLSFVSGNPSTSGVTASAGALAVNIASGSTQRLWVNISGTTSSWSYLVYT